MGAKASVLAQAILTAFKRDPHEEQVGLMLVIISRVPVAAARGVTYSNTGHRLCICCSALIAEVRICKHGVSLNSLCASHAQALSGVAHIRAPHV